MPSRASREVTRRRRIWSPPTIPTTSRGRRSPSVEEEGIRRVMPASRPSRNADEPRQGAGTPARVKPTAAAVARHPPFGRSEVAGTDPPFEGARVERRQKRAYIETRPVRLRQLGSEGKGRAASPWKGQDGALRCYSTRTPDRAG